MPRSLLSLVAVPRFLQPHLAQLAALETALRADRALVPLQFELDAHEARVLTRHDGAYHLQYGRRNGLRHYAAQVVFSPQEPDAARAVLMLGDRHGVQTVHLNGEAVLDAKRVPPAFQDAHERMVGCLKQLQARTGEGAQSAAATAAGQPDGADAPGTQADEARADRPAPELQFEPVSLERADAPTLQFRGRKLAEVVGPLVSSRRYVLTVYETPAGNQVAVRQGQSLVPFEAPRTEAKKLPAEPAERLAALRSFFGFNPTARALYRALGVEPVENID